MSENLFEPRETGGGARGGSFADEVRLGDVTVLERGLRAALQESPLPPADAVAALQAARARGERVVRRRRLVSVVAAAAAVVAVAGGGVLVAGGGPRAASRGLPAATTSAPTTGPTTTPTPATGERTIYTDATTTSFTRRPTQAPPTVPTPYVVIHTPCPGDPNSCVIGFGSGPYDPAGWQGYGDLTVLSTALGTQDMPRSVSQSADGSVLAVSGDTGWIELSKVSADGSSIEKVVRLSDPRGPLNKDDPSMSWAASVSVHPSGQYLAASWHDGAVMLWSLADLANPVRLQTVGPLTQYTPDLAWSPDGSTLATAGYDNKVRLYRLDGDRLRPGAVLTTRSDALTTGWSADGTRLAVGSYDAGAVYDTSSPDRPVLVSRFPVSTMGRLDLALSPDGRTLYTTGDKAGVYDVTRGTARRLRGLDRETDSLAVDPSGGVLATVDRKGVLTLWATSGGSLRKVASGRFESPPMADDRGLVFDASGTRLAALTAGSGVLLVGNG